MSFHSFSGLLHLFFCDLPDLSCPDCTIFPSQGQSTPRSKDCRPEAGGTKEATRWGVGINDYRRVSNWLFKSGWCWTDCSNHWYLPPYHADWSPPQYVGWFCTLNCDWLVYLCLTSPGKNSIHSVVKTEINIKNYKDMKLNVCGAFLKWGVPPNHPQIIHFSGIFHYKPSIWVITIYGNPHMGRGPKIGYLPKTLMLEIACASVGLQVWPIPMCKLSDPSEIIIIPNGTGEWKYSDRYEATICSLVSLYIPTACPLSWSHRHYPHWQPTVCVFLSQLYVCSPVIKQWISQPQSPPLRTIKAATDVETSAQRHHSRVAASGIPFRLEAISMHFIRIFLFW